MTYCESFTGLFTDFLQRIDNAFDRRRKEVGYFCPVMCVRMGAERERIRQLTL